MLFDHRTRVDFVGREHFLNYFETRRLPVVLLPHAPNNTGTTAFVPFFDQKDNLLPDYAEYWMPFRFDRIWEMVPTQRDQFRYVGYPGLDSDWLGFLDTRKRTTRRDALRCLFIIRRFTAPGGTAGDNVLSYDEFVGLVGEVERAIRQVGAEVELIVKPHPSDRELHRIQEVFSRSGIERWRLTFESIYQSVQEVDLVISVYSTTLLIPAMMGKPTVLLHCSTQDALDRWEEIRELYHGLHYYLENPEDLSVRLREVTGVLRRQSESSVPPWDRDIGHLRHFYPDGAAARCLEAILSPTVRTPRHAPIRP